MTTQFDPSKLKVGDTFYSVYERLNFLEQRKIHRVIDGEDWFKYTIPSKTYELVTHRVLGILRKDLEGEWAPYESLQLNTEFYLLSTHCSSTTHKTDDLLDGEKYFVDIDEAMAYTKILEAAAKELDKK